MSKSTSPSLTEALSRLKAPALDTAPIIFTTMAGLIIPAFLIVIIRFTGFSEILEEIAKALVVYFFILKLSTTKSQVILSLIFGILYSLSESAFYLNDIIRFGEPILFWHRLLWTIPLHVTTTLVILFSALAKKQLILLGLAGAMILHVLFNYLLGTV